MDKTITAKDLAKREGYLTVRERIQNQAARRGFKLAKGENSGSSVKARINQGRWIGDCECGGAEYVDPDEPIFFCLSCGNHSTGGKLRPVKFPENILEVETEVMSRPVVFGSGRDMIEKQLKAKAVGKARNWEPED